MYTLFQICFWVGVILVSVFFLLGGVLDLFDGDLDLDFDFLDMNIGIPSPILILIFITVFGGSGMILYQSFSLPTYLTGILAGIMGFAISHLINQIILKPLKKAQNTSTPDEDEIIGLPANVTETIERGGCGEITYVIHGNTYSSPARAENGEAIAKGTEVAICWIKDYIYYVTVLDEEGGE